MQTFEILADLFKAPPPATAKPEPAKPGRGWGWRLLPRYRTRGGKRYQLHATKGWRCIGRAAQ